MSVTSRLAHLGIAVLTLEAAEDIYRGLGLAVAERVAFPQEGLRLGFISSGGVAIELLEPQDPNTALARFLSNRGQGVHIWPSKCPTSSKPWRGHRRRACA